MKILITRVVAFGLLSSVAATPVLAQHRPPAPPHGPAPHPGPAPRPAAKPHFHAVAQSRGHHFHKGQRLAPANRRYVVNDWRQRGLSTPPRGYQWVREDNNSGDYILIAAATGLIASILAQ